MLDQTQRLLLPGQWEKLKAVEASRNFALPLGTHWIERDVFDITSEIQHRWPELRVASCSCGRCMYVGHYPHMVCEVAPDGSYAPVFGFSEFSREVIDRLFLLDAQRFRGGVKEQMQKIQEKNRSNLRAQENALNDETEERKDMVVSALRSGKHD